MTDVPTISSIANRGFGWDISNHRHSELVAVGPYDRIVVDSPSTDIREAALVAACLVAEGHDPVRLLAAAAAYVTDTQLRKRITDALGNGGV